MTTPSSSALTSAALMAAAVPLVAMSTLLLVLAGAGANASPSSAVCGGAGTGQTINGVALDAEQMGNADTIVTVTAARALPVYAAVVAVTTAYTESALHNTTVQTDHDSEGLFQQRVSIYTKPVADNPVRATKAFLDRLTRIPGWQQLPVGVDAQTVQQSRYPARYQPNAPLAAQLVGLFWPSASTATTVTAQPPATPTVRPTDGTSPSAQPDPTMDAKPAVCAGAGGGGARPGSGPAGPIIGPTGNPVAGTTTIPPGLIISGTPQGQVAVRFALAQLGKPYVFGAAGPDAFDCSGLTMTAWAAAGVPLPHLAAAQANMGTAEPTDLSQAVGGDLVFIPGSDGTPAAPGHVGMIVGYLDLPDGRHLWLIQAPETGLPVELTEASEWHGLVVAVRHLGAPTTAAAVTAITRVGAHGAATDLRGVQ